jgi:hypothetical protein
LSHKTKIVNMTVQLISRYQAVKSRNQSEQPIFETTSENCLSAFPVQALWRFRLPTLPDFIRRLCHIQEMP